MNKIIKLTLAILAVEVFYYLSSSLDLLVAGSIGVDEQLAVGISNQIIANFHVIFYGVTVAAMVLFSKYGKKDEYAIDFKYLVGMVLLLGLLINGAFVVYGYLTGFEYVSWFTNSQNVETLAISYMMIIALTIIPDTFSYSLLTLLTSNDKEKQATMLYVGTLALDFMLNVLLVLVLDKGIVAMALTTCFSKSLQLIGLSYLSFKYKLLAWDDLKLIAYFKPMIKYFKKETEILKVMFASILTEVVWVVIAFSTTLLVAQLGEVYQLTYYTTDSIADVFSCFIFALGSTASVVVMRAIATKDRENVDTEIRKCMSFGIIVQIVLSAVLVIFRSEILALFNLTGLAYELASDVLVLVAIHSILYIPCRILMYGLYKGLRPKLAFWLTISTHLWKLAGMFLCVLETINFVEAYAFFVFGRILTLFVVTVLRNKTIKLGISKISKQ